VSLALHHHAKNGCQDAATDCTAADIANKAANAAHAVQQAAFVLNGFLTILQPVFVLQAHLGPEISESFP